MIEIRKGMPIVTFSLFKKAGGIAAAIFFGYLAAVLFKPKEKK